MANGNNPLLAWFLARPLLMIAVSSLGFATQALFVKLLGNSGFGSFETVLFRGACQASGVAAVLLHWREPLPTWLGRTRKEGGTLFLRGLFGYLGIAFGFLAIQTTSLAASQVTAQTTPIFTALLSCAVLGEPWRAPEVMATVAATFGVLLIFRPAFIFGGDDHDGGGGGGGGEETATSGDGSSSGGGGFGGDDRVSSSSSWGRELRSADGNHKDDALGVVYALVGAVSAAVRSPPLSHP